MKTNNIDVDDQNAPLSNDPTNLDNFKLTKDQNESFCSKKCVCPLPILIVVLVFLIGVTSFSTYFITKSR